MNKTACYLFLLMIGVAPILIKPTIAAEKPNILIIFTDDQGYGDLACYGNKKSKTPRLDQLAKEGTRFTSFYSQAVCGPSRSALLTGRQPIRSKGWGMPASEITWAELIRDAGYQTACIGKWDVSNRKPIIDRMPNAQGFDYFFGALGANDSGVVKFHENNEAAGTTKDMGELTTLYTDKSINWLKQKRDPEKPFVLYLAHTMMHTIIDASDRFRGKSEGGLYGDVVEEFDHETGRLLDTIDDLGLSENTLVIYTSDNGPWNQPKYTDKKKGHPEGAIFWGESGPLRNGKGSPYEGGYRLPCIVRWPGKISAGSESDAIFATIDFLPTFANLAGFEVPDDRRIDGIDQTGLLLGKSDTGRDHFYFDRAGVRQGKWKYLKPKAHFYGYAIEDDRKQEDELYDLEADLGEQSNLASKFPDKVAEMNSLMASIEITEPGGQANQSDPADGLAPEVTDLNAADVSFAAEAKLPDLKKPFLNDTPGDRKDGIPVGELPEMAKDKILTFALELVRGEHGDIDSLLIAHEGTLLFESYYRRGRINYPHYQMSITKSYTAMAIGRAIQLGHLSMADLDKPVVSFLNDLDQSKLVDGAAAITLAEAMNMKSGVRIDDETAKELRKNPDALKGQGQIQAYLQHSAPISPAPREYKYQGSDPSMAMQVLEAAVPGSAVDFIKTEVLGKMGIRNFAWQDDISGLPKSAAGSSMRSRDMLKWGLLTMNGGKWKGEQLVPAEFVERATSKIHTNKQGTSYGFFWWRHEVEIDDKTYDCKSGRGAGGQFILMFPEVDLIVVITAHQKGMGKMLKTAPARILPALVNE